MFESNLWWWRIRILSIIDGDSVRALVDRGFHDTTEKPVRVAAIDCPELFSGDDRERGRAAKSFTDLWVGEHRHHAKNEAWPFFMRSEKLSFDRFVGVVVCGQGHVLADALREAGHVKK